MLEHDHGDYPDEATFRVRYKGYGPTQCHDDWRYESRLGEGAAETVDNYIGDNFREYNDGLIDATVNCAIACAYQNNNPNQEYNVMTMAVMEAM